jgi:hypothetical protein
LPSPRSCRLAAFLLAPDDSALAGFPLCLGRLVVTAMAPSAALATPTARSLAMPLALNEWRAVRLRGSAERMVWLTLQRTNELLPCFLCCLFG